MSLKFYLLLELCLLDSVLGFDDGRARYDNYRVYKVIPSSKSELTVLKNLERNTDSVIFLQGVHFVGKAVKVIVAPHKLPDFLQLLEISKIKNKLIERNFQSQLKSEQVTYSRAANDYGWAKYYKLDETYDWLKSLAKKYPKIVSLIEGGKTYENRSILGVKISHKTGNKGIFIEAGIHAREWIAPATATFIINQLLTSNDTSIKDIAQNYDWYIFPHTNPDGYVYTHTTNRMWRKTRKPNSDDGKSFGVDPNRNWDIYWNKYDTSADTDTNSETYRGPSAFSEIETKSLSNYITSLKGKLKLYLSFHSFAQELIYPYGHADELPPNINDFRKVANVTVAALGKRYGTKYLQGTFTELLRDATGHSVEWAYKKVDIKMAFLYELRPDKFDEEDYTFELPTSQIIPNGQEILDSIVAMISEVKRLGYFN